MEKRSNHNTIPSLSQYCREECEKIRKNMLDRCSIDPYSTSNGEADVAAVCRAILESTSVKKIYFDNPHLMESSLGSLSACLSSCKSLEEVELYGRNARSLLPSIVMNDSIRSLTILFQAEAVDLSNTIKTSTGLRRLELQALQSSADLPHYSEYLADEMALVAEACRRNQSIEELCLDGFKDIPVGNTLFSNLGPKLTTLELTGSCDGAAVGSLLLHSQQLRTLRFNSVILSPEECLAIKDGLSQSSSLRKLELCVCNILMGNYVPVGDMIRAASSIETFRFVTGRRGSPEAWYSIFESLGHHPHIRSIVLSTERPSGFGPHVANLLGRNTRLQHLDLGTLRDDGVNDLGRGLAVTPSLVKLRISMSRPINPNSFYWLFDQGISQCPTLESLHLHVDDCNLDTRFLARLIENSRTLRCFHLNFQTQTEEVKSRALTALVDAMALNDVLEEFRFENGTVANSELASSLSATLPKLWKLKILNICNVELNRHSESVLRQLDLNMSLTDFALGPRYPEEEHSKKQIKRIVARNRALDASDYGLTAAPSLWPPMIHLALRNEHVGPSMVYRLLSGRSGTLASYVQT